MFFYPLSEVRLIARRWSACALFLFLLAACQPAPDSVIPAPSATPVPATAISLPTATDLPPTATPTATGIPTATPLPLSITDSAGAEMLLIPAGEFIMGSEDGFVDETPVHAVYLDAFYIDRLETTNAEYRRCVEAGRCSLPKIVDCNTPEAFHWLRSHATYYEDPAYADYPVVCLDWYQAVDYCAWRDARLPSEAEWEKAARGTDGRTYPWGNEPPTPELASFLWPEDEFEERPLYAPAPVGSFPAGASPYGILDMAGNVYEWVQDGYAFDYYSVSPYENPPGVGLDSNRRIARSGSFWNLAFRLRAANRNFDAYLPADLAHFDAGVRCAGDVSEPAS